VDSRCVPKNANIREGFPAVSLPPAPVPIEAADHFELLAGTQGFKPKSPKFHRPSISRSRTLELTGKTELYFFLEDPLSSRWAKLWSLVMGMLILTSVMSMFLEPLLTAVDSEEQSESKDLTWIVFEAFFTIVFTIEYMMRFAVADALHTRTKLSFLKHPANLCDLVSILPFYLDLLFASTHDEFRLMKTVRLARLGRVVRLYRITKKSATLAPIAVILVVIWGIYIKNGLYK
jgi:hypothetical protein